MRLLKESPDKVISAGKWIRNHAQTDSRTFTIGKDWALVGATQKILHYQFVVEIINVYDEVLEMEPKDTDNPYDEKLFKNELMRRKILFHGNYKSFIKDYPSLKGLKDHKKIKLSRSMGVLTGRYWSENPKVVSLWAGDVQVKANMKYLEKAFKSFKLKLSKFSVDYLGFQNVNPLPTYKEFMSGKPAKKLTHKELMSAIKSSHTDPKIKKMLKDLGYLGSNKTSWESASKKTGIPVVQLKQMAMTSESISMSLMDLVTENEYREFVEFVHINKLLTENTLLTEFSVPGKLKKVMSFIKNLATQTKLKMKDLLKLFMNSKVYKFFAKIGFSMKKLFNLAKKGQKYYRDAIGAIGEFIAKSKISKWTTEKLNDLDIFLKTHPKTKKIAGIAVAALLIFIWTKITFIGDVDYDFNIDTVLQALSGKFSLSDLFSGPQGNTMLILFTTGLIGLTFPWPGATSIKFITAIVYTFSKAAGIKIHKLT